MAIISSANLTLSRDIDVQTSVTKTQIELTTDLSVTVFATEDATFRHGADRIRFYNSLTELAVDFTASQEANKAGTAFFSQSPRALTMAVGRVFTTAQAGYMISKAYNSVLADWVAIVDGSFEMTVDGVAFDVTLCDFSSEVDFNGVATILQTRAQIALPGVLVNNLGSTFQFVSPTTGATSLFAALTITNPLVGTDLAEAGFINALDDPQDPGDNVVTVDGYTPSGLLSDETELISLAATASGKFVYAYALDRKFRDSSDQTDVATWMETRLGILGLTLNSPLVIDPNSTGDIGFLLKATGNIRTFSTFHDNAFYYPEMAVLARMLAVDYAAEASTVTAKFKNLIGIPTVGITTTDLNVLLGKRVNVFTAVGNNARTYREGQEASDSFFIDDLINLDNYEEELQVAVFNVFLKNKKVPYNATGVNLQFAAIDAVSRRYVFNGTFSEREIIDVNGDLNQPLVQAAYTITSSPLSLQTAADRAVRKGPPFTVDVNLTGAIHSTAININAFA